MGFKTLALEKVLWEMNMNKSAKQWGHYAFARHCYKLGVDFDACYYMIFGKYPEEK